MSSAQRHKWPSKRPWLPVLAGLALALVPTLAGAQGSEFSTEIKLSFRSSDSNRFPVNFPFSPDQLPPGQTRGFLETVEAGDHFEASAVTLQWSGEWPRFAALLKVDTIDLHDRNPTSTGDEVDIDEAWFRFGRETPPALLPEHPGLYLKIGKFAHFERQDDRHLESYGLVSTAFNRFEDVGAELGADLGHHVYLKGSYTQGNPVFLRDPNALAGDNGVPDLLQPNPDLDRKSGIVIPYDTDVAGLDFDHPETALGLGVRFADATGGRGVELLGWWIERDLADTVDIDGSFYGGDLDLLLGPGNAFPFAVTSDRKSEHGGNLWLYLGGFSLFLQAVDQDLAGLPRTGFEAEVAWSFDLPLRFAARGRQLLPSVAPALRYSRLDPGFSAPPQTPSPSFAWDWEKWDAGVRLGLLGRSDMTVEYAANRFVLASGATAQNDELLVTLRLRFGHGGQQ